MTFQERLEALFPDAINWMSHRGHPVCFLCWDEEEHLDVDGCGIISPSWYSDDGTPTSVERPCTKCGVVAENEDAPDPCLGYLEGVTAACCGHGCEKPYVLLQDGTCLRGRTAERFIRQHKDH